MLSSVPWKFSFGAFLLPAENNRNWLQRSRQPIELEFSIKEGPWSALDQLVFFEWVRSTNTGFPVGKREMHRSHEGQLRTGQCCSASDWSPSAIRLHLSDKRKNLSLVYSSVSVWCESWETFGESASSIVQCISIRNWVFLLRRNSMVSPKVISSDSRICNEFISWLIRYFDEDRVLDKILLITVKTSESEWDCHCIVSTGM